ncbi:uncharacterized protein LOC130821677 [Amaranthus tricolor]|uniref:uncharacterized protein LOC130821677 n=1 Tax=Amaranthus tricolor TaxID=29722 RepID=UPI0025886711|nr:uncharacterized protein LOC130821677 [Amaranthus tricolor]
MNLEAQGFEHTVLEVKEKDPIDGTQATKLKVATNQEKAKALVLLRHHIHDNLKSKYLFIKDPKTLWDSLVERFDHHERVLFPQASHDWKNLRFSDFKTLTHAVENKGRGNYNNRGRGRGYFRERERGQGRGNFNGHGRKFQGFGRGNFPQNCQNGHYNNNSRRGKQVGYHNKNNHQEGEESICYKCGMTGHWARTCLTVKHLVELYLASQKKKGKDTD